MSNEEVWGKQEILVNTATYKTQLVTLSPTKTTDYIKNTKASKYILVLEGSGIITINTVDFSVSTRQTLFIEANSDHLYANTSDSDSLVILETSVSDNLSDDVVLCVKQMNQ